MPAALLEASRAVSVEDLLKIVGPTGTTWDFGDEDEDLEAEASSWPGKDGEDEDDVPEIITAAPEASEWSDFDDEDEPEEGSNIAVAS